MQCCSTRVQDENRSNMGPLTLTAIQLVSFRFLTKAFTVQLVVKCCEWGFFWTRLTLFHSPFIKWASTTHRNCELRAFIIMKNSVKGGSRNPVFIWQMSDSLGQWFLHSEVILIWVGTKLTDFTGCRLILIRRKPPVFKPNIWPPTSRMEWRGCPFFRARKQWMVLGVGGGSLNRVQRV